MEQVSKVAARYAKTVDSIGRIARDCDRDPADIQLLVVTKGHSIEKVRQAIDSGARMVGENYVQEALEKITTIGEHDAVRWHMIGHIQSRKSSDVVRHFDFVHSVDRVKIANYLSRYALENDACIPVLLECNLTGEESKYGWAFWNESDWKRRFDEIGSLLELKGIDIRGLMTMPPYHPDPERSRPVFRKLVELQDRLRTAFPNREWAQLSMGMSDDYPVAIEEGATILRIGTAIMGPRTTRS